MFIKFLDLAVIVTAASMAAAGAALGAEPTVREACSADFAKFCAGQDAHSDTGRACVREHRGDFSQPCRTAMQARRTEMMDKIKDACGTDIAKFCTGGAQPGEGPGHCLRDHQAELSDGCKAAFPNHHS